LNDLPRPALQAMIAAGTPAPAVTERVFVSFTDHFDSPVLPVPKVKPAAA
jgi:hypothetical protein